MIINKALQIFKEKYDRDAMSSLIELSEDRTLYKSYFNGFNIRESVDTFITYLNGYVEYRMESVGKKDVQSNNAIMEHTKLFINNKSKEHVLFEEIKIPLNESSKFIQEYVESINKLINVVNKNQSILLENVNDNESSACVLTFTEMFLDNMNQRIYPIMEYMLQSSGYYSRKQVRTPIIQKEQNFFL